MSEFSSIHALVSISQLAQKTGLTARALRHYEDVGLLRPHRTAAGVRQFTPDQCEIAEVIGRLRRCSVPLESIRRLLTETDTPSQRQARLQAVLHDRAKDLTRKLEVVAAALADAA